MLPHPSLTIREMQVQTTRGQHLTPVTRLLSQDRKCWRGCSAIATLVLCRWGWKGCVFHREKDGCSSQHGKQTDPAIVRSSRPISSTDPKELKSGSQTDMHTPTVTAALFTAAEVWKQPQCPSVDTMDEEQLLHAYNRVLSGHKRHEDWMRVTTRTDLEDIMLK